MIVVVGILMHSMMTVQNVQEEKNIIFLDFDKSNRGKSEVKKNLGVESEGNHI